MGLTIVVGGQAGSEGKGAVTARLHQERNYQFAVRVGGPNAGHTVIDEGGEKFAFRQLPVAAVVDDSCSLVIAAGSEIDLRVLQAEIKDAENLGHDIRGRLIIDSEATIIDSEHKAAESLITTGTTGKGIGGARAGRAVRKAWRVADDVDKFRELGEVTDTQGLLRAYLHAGRDIMLEGTQGYHLGSHAGFYPYCTSGDCKASDFLAAAGFAPMAAEVWVVLRTHPIRIAGDSGPLEDETSWEELGLEPEYTTVTKKIRRVGEWNPEWAIKSVEANRAPGLSPKVALTFADYWWPGLAGLGNNGGQATVADTHLLLDVREKVESISNLVGAPIAMLGTGPDTQMLLEGWDT